MILRSIACSVISLAILLVTTVAAAQSNPVVVIETSLGNITVELNQDEAPISVENFLTYVRADFYTGTIFHRVINDFMIQGGGFEPGLTQKSTEESIENEANNTDTIKTESNNIMINCFVIRLRSNNLLIKVDCIL